MRSVASSLAVLVIVLLILLIQCCREAERAKDALEDCQKSATSEAPAGESEEEDLAHLIIEHSDVGEWIDFSNSFTFNPDSCGGRNMLYRPGLLFQIGTYSVDATFEFDKIEVYANGSLTAIPIDNWAWVDIISEYDGRKDPPIDPDEAFSLYPNSHTASVACPIDLSNACLRNRMISGNMNSIKSIITYWQGAYGYEMSAIDEEDVCSGNTFRFRFHDDFRVDIYQPSDPDAGPMGTPLSYALGDVDSIKVTIGTGGGDKGQTQPPPWPYP